MKMARKVCSNNMVGIPTTDGIDFMNPEDIVRCEGLQKHTLIVTVGYEFISSYNIGEFIKILKPHGFFATHKSHLVNLKHIRKLNTEGSICMDDGSYVPLSRRRRRTFLEEVKQW